MIGRSPPPFLRPREDATRRQPSPRERLPTPSLGDREETPRRAAIIADGALPRKGAAPVADPAVCGAFAEQQPRTAEDCGEAAGGLLANVVPGGKTARPGGRVWRR